MVLHQDLKLISIALRSKAYCNGSFIAKEISFLQQEGEDAFCTWQLKVRGQIVDLSKLFIDSKVPLYEKKH
jgi:hypothetical protein